jgi:hypothetical protein
MRVGRVARDLTRRIDTRTHPDRIPLGEGIADIDLRMGGRQPPPDKPANRLGLNDDRLAMGTGDLGPHQPPGWIGSSTIPRGGGKDSLASQLLPVPDQSTRRESLRSELGIEKLLDLPGDQEGILPPGDGELDPIIDLLADGLALDPEPIGEPIPVRIDPGPGSIQAPCPIPPLPRDPGSAVNPPQLLNLGGG